MFFFLVFYSYTIKLCTTIFELSSMWKRFFADVRILYKYKCVYNCVCVF